MTDFEIKKLPEGVYNLPEIKPCGGHPRVMFKKNDIEKIKHNLNTAQNKYALNEFYRFINRSTDMPLAQSGKTNFDGLMLAAIESKAFDYVINNNEANGLDAINSILIYMRSAFYVIEGDISRQMGLTIFTAAKVYDWCYPLLTKEEKQEIVFLCEKTAAMMETKWPPCGCAAIVGHGGEAMLQRDLLAFSIAVYDEYPDIYNYVAGRYFDEFVPARNYYYKSRSYHQGTNYNCCRYAFDLWAQYLLYVISGKKIFIDECQYVGYQYFYYLRADGQLIHEGDISSDPLKIPDEPAINNIYIAFLAASFYNDEYMKWELARLSDNYKKFFYLFPSFTPVDFLITNNPELNGKSIASLPETEYFGSPNGLMVARTGWDIDINSKNSVVFMKIGEEWMANHHHLDSGTFMIYRKGMLASDGGVYDSYGTPVDYNWSKETISHNGLLIFDPSEIPFQSINSGGQRRPGGEVDTIEKFKALDYNSGKVTGHCFGPDKIIPEYSYISGDITAAYKSKADSVKRTMMFIRAEDEDMPDLFFVFDKISSKSPDFKKTFLLHTMTEPEIEKGRITVVNKAYGYNGRLICDNLLPQKSNIEKIGGIGKQWFIGDKNYVPRNMREDYLGAGWGRIEISPAQKNKTDYFLDVMYISDADDNIPPTSKLIRGENAYGAAALNTVCVFAKDNSCGNTSFKIDDGNYRIAICGTGNGIFDIFIDGELVFTKAVSNDEDIIFFEGTGGEYSIKKQE